MSNSFEFSAAFVADSTHPAFEAVGLAEIEFESQTGYAGNKPSGDSTDEEIPPKTV
jgi:hypothetical protein